MRCLLLLVVPGCLSVTYSQLNTPPHAMHARAIASVDVFSSGPPSRAHVDVALIHASASHAVFTLDKFVANIREQAAQMGCDGVVLGNIEAEPAIYAMQATCIAYSDGGLGIAKR